MRIGILTIATNKYLEYFEDLLQSFVENYSGKYEIEWFVFTDRIDDTDFLNELNVPFKVTVIPVPGFKFPEATLFRYKIYDENSNFLNSEILMHLDADMLVKSESFIDEVVKASLDAPLSFVQHPGFFRPSGIKLVTFFAKHPFSLLRDIKTMIRVGALGAWETNSISEAFVPRKYRKKYFCGGIWFGSNKAIKNMCSVLSQSIEKDLSKNIVALWHDESHLNQYSIHNDVNELSSEFCFDPTYPNLKGLRELVRAVDKGV